MITISPDKMGGQPCVGPYRFTVSQFLAELAEGRSVAEIADDFDLDPQYFYAVLEELAGEVSKWHPLKTSLPE